MRLTPWALSPFFRGCFERCCSNSIKKTPPNLSFVALRNRRPTLLRASAYRTPSEASPRRRCGHASRFLWTRPPLLGSRSAFAASLCLCADSASARENKPNYAYQAKASEVVRTVVAPPSIVVKCGGGWFFVWSFVVLFLSWRVVCCSCCVCVCDLLLFEDH